MSAAPVAPALASTVLADFESGTPITAGMSIAQAGTGACAPLTGASQALCGSNTDSVNFFAGSTLAFSGVNFSEADSISFDLAADPGGGAFGPTGGFFGFLSIDVVRVFSSIGGVNTTLAFFLADPDDTSVLASTAAGVLLAEGVIVNDTFSTITLAGVSELLSGTGDLVFQFRMSSADETIGIDNITIAPVPLPAGLGLLLAGAGALALLRRRRA